MQPGHVGRGAETGADNNQIIEKLVKTSAIVIIYVSNMEKLECIEGHTRLLAPLAPPLCMGMAGHWHLDRQLARRRGRSSLAKSALPAGDSMHQASCCCHSVNICFRKLCGLLLGLDCTRPNQSNNSTTTTLPYLL
jgi:hypothetical protein